MTDTRQTQHQDTAGHEGRLELAIALDAVRGDEFKRAAEQAGIQAPDLLKQLVLSYLAARRHRLDVEEARRQSKMIAKAAAIPGNDEAVVMAELDALLAANAFKDEWVA